MFFFFFSYLESVDSYKEEVIPELGFESYIVNLQVDYGVEVERMG